jgi:hypothetical protein
MPIEQALYGNPDAGGYRFLARSAGFLDAWLPDAERLCTGFGERPAGVACPFALFARPFGYRHVAVVQVADQGSDDAGRPGALTFRLLIVPKRLYAEQQGDLFRISDQLPPAWGERGTLLSLEWDAAPPPARTVADLRKVLDVVPARTQTLLGGVQVLVDGGRLVFVRKAPDAEIVRDLWALLPAATRAELWPATFAFGNKHGFHVLAAPDRAGPEYEHYVREEDAGDYPEGRYEFALQKAAEDGDQGELDALLARRSRGQTLRLALMLLAAFVLIPPLILSTPRREGAGDVPAKKQSEEKREGAKLDLPPASEYVPLTEAQRAELAERLRELAAKLGVDLPKGSSERALREAVTELDRALDRRAARRPARDPGPLEELGPAQRRLQALLWKHGGAEYNDARLNPGELVERLEARLVQEGVLKEGGRE